MRGEAHFEKYFCAPLKGTRCACGYVRWLRRARRAKAEGQILAQLINKRRLDSQSRPTNPRALLFYLKNEELPPQGGASIDFKQF